MDLFEKAKNLGILTEFIDGQGVSHVTDETALKIIVDAFPARTPSRFLDDIPAELVDAIDLSGPRQEAPKAVQEAKARSFFDSMSELLGDAAPAGQAPVRPGRAPR